MKVIALGFTVFLGVGSLSACSSNDDADLLATQVTTVEMSANNQFSPQQVRVKKDDIVRWEWTGGPHNVVSGSACSPDGVFASGPAATKGSFERKFDTVGTFPYYCEPHCSMGMTGEVVVEP